MQQQKTNTIASKYSKEKKTDGTEWRNCKSKIIVGNVNIPISINRISKDVEDLNTFNQLRLIYRMLSPTTAEYIFFSTAHDTFTLKNIQGHNIRGHKT